MATTILWIHAAAGAVWIGACACFVIAGFAPEPGSAEQRHFAVNAAPQIDLLAMAAAALLFLAGLINFVEAGISRQFTFSITFITVLTIKIALFIAMIAVMRYSIRIGVTFRAVIERGRSDALAGLLDRTVKAHAAVVAMGSIALLLGLWLTGS